MLTGLSSWCRTTASISGALALANAASDVGQSGCSSTAVTISRALTLENFVSHVLRSAVTLAGALIDFMQHLSLIARSLRTTSLLTEAVSGALRWAVQGERRSETLVHALIGITAHWDLWKTNLGRTTVSLKALGSSLSLAAVSA